MNPTLKVLLSELKRKVKNKAFKNMEETNTFVYIIIFSIYAVSFSYFFIYKQSNNRKKKPFLFSNQTSHKRLRDFCFSFFFFSGCCGSIIENLASIAIPILILILSHRYVEKAIVAVALKLLQTDWTKRLCNLPFLASSISS